MKITAYVPNVDAYLGYIPDMLRERDERPAAQQFNDAYSHGGGWRPFEGFKFNPEIMTIKYPGDPAFRPAARIDFRDEVILVYPSAWVLILQPDETYEISRMD